MSRAVVAVVLAASLIARAAPLEGEVHRVELANGMVWLIVERHDAPVFTGFVRVRVGGADEVAGATGLAHLFEHMAFKGTPRLGAKDWAREQALIPELQAAGDALATLRKQGKGASKEAVDLKTRFDALLAEHKTLFDENALPRLYQLNGAVGLNATTNKDLTSYFVSLPKNRLQLWLDVEAQRFAAPVLRDFYTERAVVQEERLRSIETAPAGLVFEELMHVAFVQSPYRWPTVGYAGDLATMTMADAQAFFETHYVASNAVGCVVGDVSVAELEPLLQKTFGALPTRPRPAEPRWTEAPQRGLRRSQVTFDASPRLSMAFHKPAPPSRDDAVFDVIRELLVDGTQSRLQQALVYRERLAQGVGVSNSPGSRFDNLMVVSVTPLAGVTTEAVEAAVWRELERLGKEPVSEAELDKVRRRVTTDLLRAIDSNAGVADALSRAQTLYGDWRYPLTLPSVIEGITAADVQRVAAQAFVKQNASVVTLVRP
ncbi:MAG: pitrilysin family protein [Myxococcaceae bacterium]